MNLKLRQSKKCYKCLKSEFYSYGQADECISQVLITSFFFFMWKTVKEFRATYFELEFMGHLF